jgi:hypothetical protein
MIPSPRSLNNSDRPNPSHDSGTDEGIGQVKTFYVTHRRLRPNVAGIRSAWSSGRVHRGNAVRNRSSAHTTLAASKWEVEGLDPRLPESPAEADRRTRMFKVEGAYIERVKAADCDTPEKAEATAHRILTDFKRWRSTR